MCPRFNLVFEETPREFLYQERKTSLGEGCLSKRTDQTDWVRERRTETESSSPWTVESMLFGCVILLIVSLVVATCLCCFSVLYVSSLASRLFSLSAPSLPLELQPSAWPPSSILRSLHLCICIDAFGRVSVLICCIGPIASVPPSHLHWRHVGAQYVWPPGWRKHLFTARPAH